MISPLCYSAFIIDYFTLQSKALSRGYSGQKSRIFNIVEYRYCFMNKICAFLQNGLKE